jgi:hypothetical protein
MIFNIDVTQHFIDTGSRQSCAFCPVALAITDALKLDNLTILVSPSGVGFYPKNTNNPNTRYTKLPVTYEVYSFIMTFDGWDYTQCKPFTFEFAIPDSIWKILEKANKVNSRG